MHVRQSSTRFAASVYFCTLFALSLIAPFSGCGNESLPADPNLLLGLGSASSGKTPDADGTVAEQPAANDVFTDAQPAAMTSNGSNDIYGTIDGQDDVDFYALGPVSAGDRITIDVTGLNGLNTVAALFDADGNVIDVNDDRSYYGGRLDPYISQVIRADLENLYVSVAVSGSAYFASDAGRYETGSYTVKVTHRAAQAVPQVLQQVVWLDFHGGDQVQIAQEPIETMRPFSAESISPRLAGQTDYIIQLVVQHMAEDFAEYNVVLLNSLTDAEPTVPHTSVFFGNQNSKFLGLADNVDTGNAQLVQEAIVYAEDLALFDRMLPSAEEVAQALANIGSHELGHLLGLEHTAEKSEVMATAASARQILEQDAAFHRSQLDPSVFPAGWQDCPSLLAQNVGRSLTASHRVRAADTTTAQAATAAPLPSLP